MPSLAGRGTASRANTSTGRKSYSDAEPTRLPGSEGEGSVVCLDDVVDDGEAETYACVIAVDTFFAALERFDQGGDDLWSERLAGILDGERHTLDPTARRNRDGAVPTDCGRWRCGQGLSSTATGGLVNQQ